MENKQKNDELVLQLQEKLAVKEKELKESSFRFSPKTNCRLVIFDIGYNLNVLQKPKLIELLSYLNSQKEGLKSFDPMLLKNFKIEGFHVDEWIEDIVSRIQILEQKDKESEYKKVKAKLDNLLSNEKKTELELNVIADMLN